MNNRQKMVQRQFLNNEEAVIKRLNQVYRKSLSDVQDKIKNLQFSIGKLQEKYDWMDPDDPEKAKVKSQIQSKIYQKKYQEQLQSQLDGILKQMQNAQYLTVAGYLDECYTDGFIGSIFDLSGQGVPLMMPINQESMVHAVQLESKISRGLYTRLGEDVELLKKKITAQVSRSIAMGITYAQTAKQLANYTSIGYNNAIRIARTEGHRIQTTAQMDAMHGAKDRGADLVKQWDAALDARTRESHVKVDGEWREIDEKFSNGLRYPGDPHGKAAEVINCRCALLQRARFALADGFTKIDGFTDEIKSFDSMETYDEFKKAYFSSENRAYMEYVTELEKQYGTKDLNKILSKMTDEEYQYFAKLEKARPQFSGMYRNDPIVKKGANLLTNSPNGVTINAESYAPFSTIDEAKEYAKTILGLKCTGYENINLDVANTVNREIAELYNIFGNVNQAGDLKGITVLTGKKSYVAAYSPPFKEVFFTKSNVGYKSSMKKMQKSAKEQFDFGFWSTDKAEHSIRHELGHAVQHMITDPKAGNPFGNSVEKLNKISALRNQVMQDCGITKWSINDHEHMKPAGNVLSYYALKTDGEFIAESVAEYMGGNPRDIAKKVVEILLEK